MEQQISESSSQQSPHAKGSGSAIPGLWWKLLTGLLMAGGTFAAFCIAKPLQGFTLGGNGGRIIFFHVPCAWLASVAYVVAVVYAGLYFRAVKRQDTKTAARMDTRCAATMELGLVFALLATVTGSIFSHNEWGAYWSWDPRQTSIVVIDFLFAAYLILRGSVVDSELRGRLSAAYAVVAAVPGLFLIWVLPRIVETLHGNANQAVVGGQIGGSYRLVLYGLCLPAFIGLYVWAFQLRVRLGDVQWLVTARNNG